MVCDVDCERRHGPIYIVRGRIDVQARGAEGIAGLAHFDIERGAGAASRGAGYAGEVASDG